MVRELGNRVEFESRRVLLHVVVYIHLVYTWWCTCTWCTRGSGMDLCEQNPCRPVRVYHRPRRRHPANLLARQMHRQLRLHLVYVHRFARVVWVAHHALRASSSSSSVRHLLSRFYGDGLVLVSSLHSTSLHSLHSPSLLNADLFTARKIKSSPSRNNVYSLCERKPTRGKTPRTPSQFPHDADTLSYFPELYARTRECSFWCAER